MILLEARLERMF